jgi:hypothetical protein
VLKNNASLLDQELIENATNIEKFLNDVGVWRAWPRHWGTKQTKDE